MADTWWHEETKCLIAIWSEEAIQQQLNRMHNKKTVWDNVSRQMEEAGYKKNGQQCRVKINNLKQKYRKTRDGNRQSGNKRQDWELFELLDSVLGCKPTSEPLVVIDSILSSAEEAGTSLESDNNSSDAFTDIDALDAGFTVDFDVESHLDESSLISSEEGDRSGVTETALSHNLSPVSSSKAKQTACRAKEENISQEASTSKKRKKRRKRR